MKLAKQEVATSQSPIYTDIGAEDEVACIGKNGGGLLINRDYKIAEGFSQSVRLLSDGLVDIQANIDTLVYPLYFCARHAVELMIKTIMRTMVQINRIRKQGKANGQEDFVPCDHNIRQLFNEMRSLSEKTDKRYRDCLKEGKAVLSNLEDYDEDVNGDEFRYASGIDEDDLHLNNHRFLSVTKLTNRFFVLFDYLDYFFNYSSSILQEYWETKTFTESLSRAEIIKIADALGRSEAPNAVSKEFGISSEQIEEAKKIIFAAPFLSIRAGRETVIHHFSFVSVSALKQLFSLRLSHGNENQALGIASSLSVEDIPYILAFTNIGSFDAFPECVDSYISQLKESLPSLDINYVGSHIGDGTDLRKGLKKCGQKTIEEEIFGTSQ